MNMLSLSTGFELSVAAYTVGAFASLACWRKPALARRICCSAALAGAVLGGLTSVLGILRGTPVAWSAPSGVPLFAYSFSYDASYGGSEDAQSRRSNPQAGGPYQRRVDGHRRSSGPGKPGANGALRGEIGRASCRERG